MDPLSDEFSSGMGKLGRPRLQASRARARMFTKSGTVGLLGFALATATAACTGTSSSPPRSAYPSGCSRAFRLEVSAKSAVPKELLTVSAQGSWPTSDVTTESYGLLGTVRSGRFVPSYNLAAIVPGIQNGKNFPVGASGGVGGVGLPNKPFKIEVPPVSSGSYIVEFSYSAAPASNGGAGPKVYNLCALLHIRA